MHIKIISILLLLTALHLEAESTTIDTSIQNLHFSHSRQKDHGKRYTLHLSQQRGKNHYQIAWEKSNTQTFKPPLKSNLHVNKYFLSYSRKTAPQQAFIFSYATIDDNIAKETDGGKIYGIGYRYKAVILKQYLSNYQYFDVYQSEVVFKNKKQFTFISLHYMLIAKYLHLHENTPNRFTKNAQKDYFTPGFKLHFQKADNYAETGAYFGRRLFAVMHNGFSVQHHAMEFKEHYLITIGKKRDKWGIKLSYIYLKADEIPLNNKNVTVKNFIFGISYNY